MKDTAAAVDREYRARLLERSGEDRVRMGCSMHAAALALVRASVLERDPHISPAGMRRAIFLRVYGDEFAPAVRENILRKLARGDEECDNGLHVGHER